ncbi:helix-turn-helix domain-containing protein [Bacillus sp. Marseille-P3800]|uniref:helix-turn-helix domain-containing protein n=1 Tax=Bacillus sp. Marseille-P3800 TaxID=2014782 RepID=UPI000C073815|nr:helix-turn-helix transcriptional regulator [Bacillus sp. Marseille-P3800]
MKQTGKDLDKEYGSFIKSRRIKSGFSSQAEFSKATGITPATISRIESGVHRPSAETLLSFSKHLKSTTAENLFSVCGYWNSEEKVIEDEQINLEEEALIEEIKTMLNDKTLSDKKRDHLVRNLKLLIRNMQDIS